MIIIISDFFVCLFIIFAQYENSFWSCVSKMKLLEICYRKQIQEAMMIKHHHPYQDYIIRASAGFARHRWIRRVKYHQRWNQFKSVKLRIEIALKPNKLMPTKPLYYSIQFPLFKDLLCTKDQGAFFIIFDTLRPLFYSIIERFHEILENAEIIFHGLCWSGHEFNSIVYIHTKYQKDAILSNTRIFWSN